MELETRFVEEVFTYTGAELHSHFAYEKYNVIGNSIVCFRGKMKVDKHLVDLEDAKNKAFIYSKDSLNFILEVFNHTFLETILLQRLFVRIVQEFLSHATDKANFDVYGNDLYLQEAGKKLKASVSIVTASQVSHLMHFGINISSKGTPIPTVGLSDLNIDPKVFAARVLYKFQIEYNKLFTARAKVKGVA